MSKTDEKIKELGFVIDKTGNNYITYKNEGHGISVDVQWSDVDYECLIHAFDTELQYNCVREPYHESIGLDIIELQAFMDKLKEMKHEYIECNKVKNSASSVEEKPDEHGMIKHKIGENCTIMCPSSDVQNVPDVPFLIRDFRDQFHYDSETKRWIHNVYDKVYATNDTVSVSFVSWMNDNVKLKPADKITNRYGDKSVMLDSSKNKDSDNINNVDDFDENSLYIGINDMMGVFNLRTNTMESRKDLGEDILSVTEYRLKLRSANQLPKEIRKLPKAHILFRDIINDCIEIDIFNEWRETDKPIHINPVIIPSVVKPADTMISENLAKKFTIIYKMIADIIHGNTPDLELHYCKKYLKMLLNLSSDDPIFKLIKRDFIEWVLRNY